MPTDLETHHVLFSHPEIARSLVVTTGANQISWAYNLNTVSYPTYAGEVVQVLSCNIDNLQIEGEVRSYAEMEEIYRWFLEYMQKATQGQGGINFVGSPVKMEYPHRGWTLYIKPIQLPGLRYGREVVIPTWSLSAHIEDPDPEMRALTIDNTPGAAAAGEVENFRSRITASVGYRQDNPFSDPLATITKEENELYGNTGIDLAGIKVEGSKAGQTEPDLKGFAKQMQDVFASLLKGTFKDLLSTYDIDTASGPAKTKKKKTDEESTKDSKTRK